MDFITDLISTPFVMVGWLIIGVLAGEIARRIMGSGNQGCLSDWLLGIVGSFAGGFIAGLVGFDTPDIGFGLGTLIIAVFGAVLLIGLRRAITGRR